MCCFGGLSMDGNEEDDVNVSNLTLRKSKRCGVYGWKGASMHLDNVSVENSGLDTPTGNVANSDKADAGSITGTTAATVIVACNAGYSGTSATVCQPSGLFSSVPSCVKCVSGKYNDDTTKSDCKDDCGAGSFIVKDQSSCDACPFGQWQDLDDQYSCKKCAAGKISEIVKQVSVAVCQDCIVGLIISTSYPVLAARTSMTTRVASAALAPDEFPLDDGADGAALEAEDSLEEPPISLIMALVKVVNIVLSLVV